MYVFESITNEKNALILFLGQYNPKSKTGLHSEIQKAFDNNLTPELISIIIPSYLTDPVKELFKDSGFRLELERYGKTPVICVSFDEFGEFSYCCDGYRSNEVDLKKLESDVVKYGYINLMKTRASDVLVKSPSGTIFSKPSGKTLEEFIYASQLARTSCENQFLAMSLLKYSPKFVDHIYIDTASISAIAEAIIYYKTKFNNEVCKYIKYSSYSSYSGLEKSKPSNTDGAWVIISASASTSMGRKMIAQWNIRPNQVVTILSYELVLQEGESNIGNSVVFSVDEYSNRDKKIGSPIRVQVQGENFSAEVSTPKQILLRKPHKPKFIDGFIYKFRDGAVFKSNKDSRCIYVDYEAYRKKYYKKDSDIKDWMKQVSTWSIPRNLQAIIISNDQSHKQFYRDFKLVLNESGFDFDNNKIKLIYSQNEHEFSNIRDGSVLVLSPVISSGNCFVDINRSLRLSGHTGMRIFVTCFVTSPSQVQHELFKKSLELGVNGFDYEFISYKVAHLGRKDNSTWVEEERFINNLIEHSESESDGLEYWLSRKECLERKGDGLNGLLGLACSDVSEKLKLTQDFAFWPGGYSGKKFDLEAVYATVLSILQNLREHVINNETLKSNIYQHSVLAPENFVRFNDSVLQSCLWRSAVPSELDYRRSDELSSDFQRILTKIMAACDSDRGKVSIDLLVAIAIRWIKLSDKSIVKIIDDAKEYLTQPHAILLIEEMNRVLEIEKKREALAQ